VVSPGDIDVWTRERKWIVGQMVRSLFVQWAYDYLKVPKYPIGSVREWKRGYKLETEDYLDRIREKMIMENSS
jgi:hypothetical protein